MNGIRLFFADLSPSCALFRFEIGASAVVKPENEANTYFTVNHARRKSLSPSAS